MVHEASTFNGSVLGPFAELPAGAQIRTRQPLSINHYSDTSLAACERKARLTRFRAALKQRLRHGRDCESKLDVHMAVCDPVLATYANATNTRRRMLFGQRDVLQGKDQAKTQVDLMSRRLPPLCAVLVGIPTSPSAC